jgi:hypothetical protein
LLSFEILQLQPAGGIQIHDLCVSNNKAFPSEWMCDLALTVLRAVVSSFSKGFFFIVTIEGKGPKCRMKIVNKERNGITRIEQQITKKKKKNL